MEEERRTNEPHILMFPFMAQGHLIPFLSLATLIERRAAAAGRPVAITIVNTPLNVQALRRSLPPSSSVRLASLPFNGTDHGLPSGVESTDSLALPLFYNIFCASLDLQPAFERFVCDVTERDGRPPACIVSDMFLGWTVEVARRLGIFHTVFIASGAYGTAIFFDIWLHLPHLACGDGEEIIPLPGGPELGTIRRSRMPHEMLSADGEDWSSYFHQRVLSSCMLSDGMLFNTVEGLEEAGLKYFSRNLSGRPVWAVGPVVARCSREQREKGKDAAADCIPWLDKQPPRSVLYICFGSQLSISSLEMTELAHGLESSGRKFIWVVRPPSGFYKEDQGESKSEHPCLPEGFEDRIRETGQGILVRKWAPQIEILAHSSTGAFMSHCGWNSVLESLTHGVPVIGWPLGGEQLFNSQKLEEVGVCVEVARGVEEFVDGRSAVVEAVECVMGETEKGEEIRRASRRVKEMMEEAMREDEKVKGSSIKAIEDFLTRACSDIGRGRDDRRLPEQMKMEVILNGTEPIPSYVLNLTAP